MVEKAVRKPVHFGRLHKAILDIELYQSDPLDQKPRDQFRQHSSRFGVVLTHDKPHLGRVASAACPAHALQETGHRKRRVDLECSLQLSDIDAEFQRRRRAYRHQRIIILHLLFRALSVGRREISVMDEKALRLVIVLAVLPQVLAYRFAFLAGVGEDKTLFPPGMLENVAHTGIRLIRCGICRRFFRRCFHCDRSSFVGLRIRIEKMLHRKPPDLFARIKSGDNSRSPAAGCQKFARRLRISYGCGQTDPSGIASGQSAHALDQAECLHTAVSPQQRMDLVDHNEPQIMKERRDLHVLVDHERFQRFRRDLQDARGLLHQLPLLGLRDVSVPAIDSNSLLLAQLVQTPELVVDQCLERCDIEHADTLGRLFIKQRKDRKEGRLRLSGRGRRC